MLGATVARGILPRKAMDCLGKEQRITAGLLLVGVACLTGAALNAGRGTATAGTVAGARRAPDNVLLITIDTLRPDHLGCYGNRSVQTPNLDALAARGTRFADAVTAVPLTLPAHASILTGTYPPVHGVRDMGGFVLGESPPTLATLAAGAGLRTAAIVGSAALDHHYGLNRGFETYDDQMTGPSGGSNMAGPAAVSLPERRAGVVIDHALAWLAAHHTGRFFLWIHLFDPHAPYDPPEPYRGRYAGRLYDGEIAYTDAQLSRLFEGIRRQGLEPKTLVAVLGDHGESLGEHGETTHGIFLYDTTIRIPFILAGPGVPSGKVVEQQVRSIDLAPTILAALRLSVPSPVQGNSLWPVVEGERALAAESRYAYLETIYPRTHMGWSELRALRSAEWKYIQAPEEELYDLRKDAGERVNSLKSSPMTAERYKTLLSGILGKGDAEVVTGGAVSPETRQELASLGYASAGVNQPLKLDRSAPDPKSRVKLLPAFESAVTLMSRREYVSAARELERVLRADPANPLFRLRLGICYELLGNATSALATYQEASARHYSQTDEMFYREGNLLMDRGELPQAVEAFERALKLNPAHIGSLNNLGNCYLQLGRLAESEKAFEAMLVEDPKAASAYNGLGLVRIEQGKRAEAAADFQKALDHDPRFWEAWLNLGLYYQEEGRRSDALRCLEEFSRGAPASQFKDALEKARRMIVQLRSAR
jgi:choline-sulfatase